MPPINFPRPVSRSTSAGKPEDTTAEQPAVPATRPLATLSGVGELAARRPLVRGESPYFGARTRIPLSHLAHATASRPGRIVDMKVTALDRDLQAGEKSGIRSGLSPSTAARIQDIAEQLARGVASQGGPRPTQAPVDGAWTYFQALDGLKGKLSEAQLLEARALLKGPIAASAHSIADIRLMSEVIDAATTPGGQALATFLTRTVLEGLCLDQFQTPGQMREPWEEEPNSRTFNSVLPSIAGVIYEHAPVGRTLLWEGACGLFPGASEARRRETLKTLVFEFPCDPGEDQERLEDTYEFIMAVDAMDIDEKYDVGALKEQFKLHEDAAQET
jgi:hypothetical protein